MRSLIYVTFICAALPLSVSADSLWGKVKDGAAKTGAVIGNTANEVGNAVEESVTSTTEMVTGEATPALTRQKIDQMAAESLDQLFASNRDAKALYDLSYGFAVFDSRQLTLVGATAGYGRGVAVSQETGERIYMKMGTGGVGLAFGIGGFDRKVIVLFENSDLFYEFVNNGYDATAQASTKIGDESEGEEVRFVDGRSIFILTKKGWNVSASAAGTKYWKDADLN